MSKQRLSGLGRAGAVAIAAGLTAGCASDPEPAPTTDANLRLPDAAQAVTPDAPLVRDWRETSPLLIDGPEPDWRVTWLKPGRGDDVSPIGNEPDPVMQAESLGHAVDTPSERLGVIDYAEMVAAWVVWPAEPFYADGS